MLHQTSFIKRYSLNIGLALMFLYTWPIDLANSGVLPLQLPLAVYITLGWGFIFASLLMTGLTLGREAASALLRRYVQWHVAWKWYAAAILLEPIFVVAGVYINAALTGVPPDFSSVMAYRLFGKSSNLILFVLPFLLVEIITNGEEIGWRGYVLPRLQARHSALTSTVILGAIWGIWHLPKYLAHFSLGSFAWFMLHIMAYAILLTWLYNNTNGSLLIVALSHALSNTTAVFMPMANTGSGENMGAYIIYVLLEVAAAGLIILATGPEHLSRTEQRQVQREQSGPTEEMVLDRTPLPPVP